MRSMINETLDDIEKLKTKKEKIQLLKSKMVEFPEIRKLLAINFNHEGEGFNGLPVGVPEEFKEDKGMPVGYSDFVLAGVWRKLYVYSDVNLNPNRKLQLYIQLLEGLHPFEAKLINLAKDGNLYQLYPWMKTECYETVFDIPATKKTKPSKEEVEEEQPEIID